MKPIDEPLVNVLLVDDRAENIMALKALLDRSGYRLFAATSGEEALRLALREDFALILLDVLMPGMDGFEVAACLKQVERTRYVPIIFLTAVATDTEHIYRAYSTGAVDYLVKPLDVEAVRKKVAVFAELWRQRHEIQQQAQLLKESQQREHDIQIAKLRLASDKRYRKLVEGIDHAITWTADFRTLKLSFVSRQAERMLGYTWQQMAADDFLMNHIHPDDRENVLGVFGKAALGKEDGACNHRMFAANGEILWFHTGVSAEPSLDVRHLELHGISVDITDVKRVEEAQRFLATLAIGLSESLDYDVILITLARQLATSLGDWCIIDHVADASRPRQIAGAHADPRKEGLVRELGVHPPRGPLHGADIARVIQTGKPAICRTLNGPASLGTALGMQRPEILMALGAASCMFIPIGRRGQVTALITVVSASPERRFGAMHVPLAEELASRVALAVDNATFYREAQRAADVRDRLLAIVSHDLRNPLSAIKMSAETLVRPMAPHESAARVSRSSRVILHAVEHMERLIRDLLDLAGLQAGQLRIACEAREVGDILRETLELLTAVAQERDVSLIANVDSPLLAWCDRERIVQVLSNLIGNATKFSAEGGTVTVEARPLGTDVVLSVADTGPGIAPENLPHIFDQFWQAERRVDGLGLGLSIAKALVEAHGGRLWVESTVGHGTTFFFTLPQAGDGATIERPAQEHVLQ